MKGVILKKIFVLLSVWALSSVGVAQETSTTSTTTTSNLTGVFGASTDYLWRGITFSEHKPIIRGGMNYSTDGLNLGAWVSTSQGYGSSLKGEGNDATSDENGLENFLAGRYTLNLTGAVSTYVGFDYFYYPFNKSSRYGRNYIGTAWTGEDMNVAFEVSSWDYGVSSWPSDFDSMDFRVMASMMGVNLMVISEEDHFSSGSAYQYYQVSTDLKPPMSWEFPEDLFLGVVLGYADYSKEDKVKNADTEVTTGMGTTSYFHYMLSVNRNIGDYTASIFFSDTTREVAEGGTPLSGDTDRTVGFSFLRAF